MAENDYARQLEIQRAHFEAQFGSLEDMGFSDRLKNQDRHASDSESEFGGFSHSDEGSHSDGDSVDDGISSDDGAASSSYDTGYQKKTSRNLESLRAKVIRLNTNHVPTPASSKADAKLLRLGRAPTLLELERKEQRRSKAEKHAQAQAQQEDGEHLENDLKLQRLLSESHILARSIEYSGADVTMQTLDYEDPTGTARRRVLDARIRAAARVNSKTGGLPSRLEKMPMHMRRGMIKTRDERIARYEREARDAGIVLARVQPGSVRDLDAGRGLTPSTDRLGSGHKVHKRNRDKGLRINGVGRNTRNGLVIAQKDIDRINRTGRGNKSKKK